MALPYQYIQARNSFVGGDATEWTLLGACGSRLVAQSSSGATSLWPVEDDELSRNRVDDEAQEPPGKRVKLSPPPQPRPNFCCLSLSNNKQYLVAATAEDRCIRVFQIELDCCLTELSQRCMARRLCAITLTPDDSIILCADKFGDVYAIPLLPSPDDEGSGTSARRHGETAPKQFVPSASLLTVHSGRNRKVLEEQIKQSGKGQKKTKETMKFKHELLLGHVSMLTDIVYATIDPGTKNERPHGYIITADRDEHIRISRGPPQAHIIEGFCQGHEEFVSRLCLTTSGLLVSGGGDTCLLVWDWLHSRLVDRLCIRDTVLFFLKADSELASRLSEESGLKIAVCGIWSVPRCQPEREVILVACEGIPALFRFGIQGTQGASKIGEIIPLSGNALDVAFICPPTGACTAVVSVDNLHKPGSTTETREHEGPFRLQYFSYQDGEWREDRTFERKLEWFSSRALVEKASSAAGQDARSDSTGETARARLAVDEKAVRDMLYGMENLRKRPGSED
ncbi:tRNA methyltransferas-like protein [Lindgomyces ingoldianus]|uniref:tRNA methyltransferas-like protein n=1 Tax=Lindgomyces ingoldianus TaxID=673940 RepID=A0ACB6QMB1_9PLEO|nr:tRNA methyltransferas-like protein [Lindgomyces ingoldianus]KAF2468149.1 tRNA methyltransferas-like protein [Lindgomyces ingoldianus]